MEDLSVTEVGKRGRRRLSAVVGDVARMNIKVVGKIGITREERQLEGWDFGEEAAVYFESVTMNVDDVGTYKVDTLCGRARYIYSFSPSFSPPT